MLDLPVACWRLLEFLEGCEQNSTYIDDRVPADAVRVCEDQGLVVLTRTAGQERIELLPPAATALARRRLECEEQSRKSAERPLTLEQPGGWGQPEGMLLLAPARSA